MLLEIAAQKIEGNALILAGDVGASKTNLALCNWNGTGLQMQKEASFKTKNFTGLLPLIEEFLEGQKKPGRICLGVAGLVQEGKAVMTNVGWQINSDELASHFNVPFILINDLEATANSLAILDENDVHVLHAAKTYAKGNVAIIAPGTGLGEAGLYFDKEGYHPFATEGGHAGFAPGTELDLEVFHFAKKKFEHVSWERMLSGPGICLLYDFFLHQKESEEPAWLKEKLLAHDKATVISQNATECAICRDTMALFIRYLAMEGANLALKFKASGGLFIAGGIVPHLLPILQKEFFIKWFCQAGRLKFFLQEIQVTIILNEKAPLLGAAYYGLSHSA